MRRNSFWLGWLSGLCIGRSQCCNRGVRELWVRKMQQDFPAEKKNHNLNVVMESKPSLQKQWQIIFLKEEKMINKLEHEFGFNLCESVKSRFRAKELPCEWLWPMYEDLGINKRLGSSWVLESLTCQVWTTWEKKADRQGNSDAYKDIMAIHEVLHCSRLKSISGF